MTNKYKIYRLNLTQQRFEGFLKTPVLWSSNTVYNLTQFQIEHQSISFDIEINSKQRLGKYVERFVSFQLSQDLSIEVIAENVQISKDKITLGELDCLLYQNGNPIHLEVIYKFYIYDSDIGDDELACWIGPNRKDSLLEKLDKLKQKQLPLLHSDECLDYLKTIPIDASTIWQQVYFKAQLFIPLDTKNVSFSKINKDCVVGFYIHHKDLGLHKFKEAKFYIPNKKDWLMVPHTNVNWMSYKDFATTCDPYLDREFSPMCWIKSQHGELQKFFLIWW